ncbi:MAG: nucleotidyltransferase domain-containing protein [Candidatus Hydrogenedentes bacterium]|nr:nucleotidyltransferase domain-containing protein [Candidatus Hydrogenedentota bacterium]
MVDKSIIASVQQYLRCLEESGIPVRFGVLFGSQVTGHVHEWSDIDVLVVSSLYDEDRNYKTVGQLWRVANDMDTRIEPIACGALQWDEDNFTPIVEIARTKGIIIDPAAA